MYVYAYIYIYIHIYIYIYTTNTSGGITRLTKPRSSPAAFARLPRPPGEHGRFPKCPCVVLGRDPGTLKSDIVSKNIHY